MSYPFVRRLSCVLFCFKIFSGAIKKSLAISLLGFLLLIGNQAYALDASYTVERSTPTEATTNASKVVFQIDFLAGAKVFDLVTSDVSFLFNTGNATIESVTPSLDSNRYFVNVTTGVSGAISIRLNPTTDDDSGGTYNLSPTVVSEIYTIDKTPPRDPILTVSPLKSIDPTPLITGTADPDSTVTVSSDGSQGCSVLVPANGIWSCEVSPALPFGVNLLNVQAIDSAGNTSATIPVSMLIIEPTADDDNDSILNEDEFNLGDTDRDGEPNYNDADDDNDGIPTIDELPGDTDNDGIPDYLESNIIDTDGDGNFDFNDADDDGDGKTTNTEITTTPNLAFIDADTDGIPDHLDRDTTNSSGTADSSGDSDSNGISDLIECPNATSKPCPDLDHDGIPDYTDTDNDNDELSDITEIGTDPANPIDSDNDTVADYYEPNNRDTDGDTLLNHLDSDDDGDNMPTAAENPIYNDADLDNIPDYLDPDTNASSPTGNIDGDADNDTVLDRLECPSGTICPDSDGDTIPDYMDPDSLASVAASSGTIDTALKGGGSFNVFLFILVGLTLFLRKLTTTFMTKRPFKAPAKKSFVLILPLAIILFNQQLFAFNSLDKQWYVGGALGQSKLSPDGHGVWNLTEDTDTGKKIYAGMDINKSLGVEAFWNDFGSATVSNGITQQDVKYSALGANVIYHAPVYLNKLHPFGKLGLAKLDTKSNGPAQVNQLHDYSVFAGLGAEYGLSENVTLRGEYEYFDKDIKQLSMGLNWAPKGRAQNSGYKNQKTAAIPAALPNTIVSRPPPPRPVQTPPQPRLPQKPIVKQTQYKTINRTLSGGSNFDTGSAQLNISGRTALTSLARDIKRSRLSLNSIQIAGHTDNVGNDYSNQILSEQRANTVANFLASQGISRQAMRTIGFGERQPILSNSTEQGRARNRRVEISIQGSETVAINHH